MKFKVGDRVRWKSTGRFLGTIIENDNVYPGNEYTISECGAKLHYDIKGIEKIGDPMSKYQELKERIEALDNGWTKEADDILNELDREGTAYRLSIPIWHGKNNSGIIIYKGDKEVIAFRYYSQCEKLKAFKKALMWLLDHSSIKNEKQDKIDNIQEQINELQKKLEDLK